VLGGRGGYGSGLGEGDETQVEYFHQLGDAGASYVSA